MITLTRYLVFLCMAILMCECGSQSDSVVNSWADAKDKEVTLCLQVNVNDAVGNEYAPTREGEMNNTIFNPPAWEFEKIHTLRVIIVRPDNTIEYNYFESLPSQESVNKFHELEFPVSIDQGYLDEQTSTIKENKKIYLIANEAAIKSESLRSRIQSLKPGGKYDHLYDGGIMTNWIMETPWETYAKPMIDNDISDVNAKQFIPMTEFYDIVVEGKRDYQYEQMFITRTFVKFEFEIEGSGVRSMMVNSIRFGNLNQKEYLFPYQTVYYPEKYQQLSNVDEGRVIVSYVIPDDNRTAAYVFSPINFGFSTTTDTQLDSSYNPQLYFCESQTFKGDATHNHVYEVGISGILTDNEGIVYNFEFSPKELDNLTSLPRNTVVRIKFIIKDLHDLECEVTVLPYTGVYLDPIFGIER